MNLNDKQISNVSNLQESLLLENLQSSTKNTSNSIALLQLISDKAKFKSTPKFQPNNFNNRYAQKHN